MATVQKFYLHDATSPNLGSLPTFTPDNFGGGTLGAGTPPAGATTNRDATGVIGTANPDTKATMTSAATTAAQRLGLRRFCSRPLAAVSLTAALGSWTLSQASLESAAQHNGATHLSAYVWRPSTGAQVGAVVTTIVLAEPGTTETAASGTAAWGGTTTVLDGDILVFDFYNEFTQATGTARTFSFCYDGTVEASTTTCASFVNAPVALNLFSPSDVPGSIDRRTPRRRILQRL